MVDWALFFAKLPRSPARLSLTVLVCTVWSSALIPKLTERPVILVPLVMTSLYCVVWLLALSLNFDTMGGDGSIEKAKKYEEGFADRDTSFRVSNAQELTANYYDFATDVYQYGWGDCFHFNFRMKGEKFQEAQRKHEYWLASKAGIQANENWLDLGCGIGGPARNIARFTEAKVTGVNLSAYQVVKAKHRNNAAGLAHLVNVVCFDYTNLVENIPDMVGKYDGAYAIEAVCHAPDLKCVYTSIFNMLKPGGVYACYEWVMTEKFDSKNAEHARIKHGIEMGSGVANMRTMAEVLTALKDAGFDIIEYEDRSNNPLWTVPWYDALTPKWFDPRSWPNSSVARAFIRTFT
eukprot:GHVN01069399.1.p1 GENE.GHVN01069399.1~~GHVN01069399.1.p1  ORF type:complete len:360 (+),score=21.69 GHVN01069399.1:35-1081(+)